MQTSTSVDFALKELFEYEFESPCPELLRRINCMKDALEGGGLMAPQTVRAKIDRIQCLIEVGARVAAEEGDSYGADTLRIAANKTLAKALALLNELRNGFPNNGTIERLVSVRDVLVKAEDAHWSDELSDNVAILTEIIKGFQGQEG